MSTYSNPNLTSLLIHFEYSNESYRYAGPKLLSQQNVDHQNKVNKNDR